MQDFTARKLLESMIGHAKVMAIIEDEAGRPVTMKKYPHGNDFILKTRERINEAIKENLK